MKSKVSRERAARVERKKKVVKAFLARWASDDMVPHEWLEKQFGVSRTRNVKSKRAWQRWTSFLKIALLREQIYIQSVRNVGYRVVPPGEIAKLATEIHRTAYRNADKRFRDAMDAISLPSLTARETMEKTAVQAKFRELQVQLQTVWPVVVPVKKTKKAA